MSVEEPVAALWFVRLGGGLGMIDAGGAGRGGSRRRRRLSDSELELATGLLKVASEPTRVRLMELLDERGDAGVTVQELTDRLPCTVQNVSHQLKVMRQASMVSCVKSGRQHRYRLRDWTGLLLVHKAVESVAASVDELRIALDDGTDPSA